jgi:hypothetical protein
VGESPPGCIVGHPPHPRILGFCRTSPKSVHGRCTNKCGSLNLSLNNTLNQSNTWKYKRTLRSSPDSAHASFEIGVYRRTGNLPAVQLLLGHTKIESTVRYLGIEIDDAVPLRSLKKSRSEVPGQICRALPGPEDGEEPGHEPPSSQCKKCDSLHLTRNRGEQGAYETAVRYFFVAIAFSVFARAFTVLARNAVVACCFIVIPWLAATARGASLT